MPAHTEEVIDPMMRRQQEHCSELFGRETPAVSHQQVLHPSCTKRNLQIHRSRWPMLGPMALWPMDPTKPCARPGASWGSLGNMS